MDFPANEVLRLMEFECKKLVRDNTPICNAVGANITDGHRPKAISCVMLERIIMCNSWPELYKVAEGNTINK